MIAFGGIFAGAGVAMTSLPPPYREEAKAMQLLPTRFHVLKLPLREGEITVILPVGDVFWINATNGLFLFDGISSAPREGPVSTSAISVHCFHHPDITGACMGVLAPNTLISNTV
jgi:hypothetical protein